MRLLKKVVAVGLASAMVFSMAGCGFQLKGHNSSI